MAHMHIYMKDNCAIQLQGHSSYVCRMLSGHINSGGIKDSVGQVSVSMMHFNQGNGRVVNL